MLEKKYIAKKEFGTFQTMLFRENSDELEPQIRKNWSRPVDQISDRPKVIVLDSSWFLSDIEPRACRICVVPSYL